MELNEDVNRIKELMGLLNESNGKIDVILVGGLDYRSGDKNIGEQVSLLKKGIGEDKSVQGFRYNTSTGTILNVLKTNPKIPIFLFSAGCRKAEELARDKNVDVKKLFIIEPYALGSKTKISVRNAVGMGVPSQNVFVGGNGSRGKDIVNGTSSSQSKSHWGALSSVGNIVKNKLNVTTNKNGKYKDISKTPEKGFFDKMKDFFNYDEVRDKIKDLFN